MGAFSLTSCTVHLGGYDLTSDINKVTVGFTGDENDVTTFGSAGWRKRAGGLTDLQVQHTGFAAYADPDATLFADLAAQSVFTVTPDGADGTTAYFFNGESFEYTPLDSAVGAAAGFSGSAKNYDSYGLVRGALLLPKQTITGALSGTGVQLGAVSATQKQYAAVHVFTAGTTADVIVESGTTSGFGTSTVRSTTTVTAAGGTFVVPVAGSISHTWWRVRTANVTGSFSIAAAVGIK